MQIMQKRLSYFIILLISFIGASISAEGIPTSSQQDTSQTTQKSKVKEFIEKATNTITQTTKEWKNTLSKIFDSTQSNWIRIIIALLFGILLSLTPCIYPMIPITIGILQINQSKSTLRSFLLAASYTLGISTTFTIFGLIAAFGSTVFGQLQGSPIFIVPLAALLFYFGLSMFGLYEIYIPKFLQPKQKNIKGGSPISAFIFGMISGSVASPCLSPGLLIILNYVSHINTAGSIAGYLEGFLLLFVFGIGSSLPLLIIGTFSASMSVMPRAGIWMLEVKRLFGLMLVGMGFYNLSHLEYLFPKYLLLWAVTISIVLIAKSYFISISKYDSIYMRIYKIALSIILAFTGGFIAMKSYKATFSNFNKTEEISYWGHDLTNAKEKALEENKLLFIDIGATYCGSCKAIDKKIFQNPKIINTLTSKFVPLKIEADSNEQDFDILKENYKSEIKGFPTFLIINPKNNLVIKKWTEDIDDLTIEDIINQLNDSLKESI